VHPVTWSPLWSPHCRWFFPFFVIVAFVFLSVALRMSRTFSRRSCCCCHFGHIARSSDPLCTHEYLHIHIYSLFSVAGVQGPSTNLIALNVSFFRQGSKGCPSRSRFNGSRFVICDCRFEVRDSGFADRSLGSGGSEFEFIADFRKIVHHIAYGQFTYSSISSATPFVQKVETRMSGEPHALSRESESGLPKLRCFSFTVCCRFSRTRTRTGNISLAALCILAAQQLSRKFSGKLLFCTPRQLSSSSTFRIRFLG